MKILSYLVTLFVGVLLGFTIASSRSKTTNDKNLADLDKPITPSLNSGAPTSSSQKSGSIQSPLIANNGISLPPVKQNRQKSIDTLKSDFDNSLSQSDFDSAVSALGEMENLENRSRQFMESKSRLLVKQRNWDDAKEALKQCLTLYPKSISCLVDMSSTELQVGSKEDQEKAISSCLLHVPNEPQCRNMWGILKMHQGKYDEAISIYRQLLKDNGSYGLRFEEPLLNWQLAIALERAKNIEESLIYFDKACRGKFSGACQRYEEVRARL